MAICRKPWITLSQDIAPCGQCPECLINRKQLWTNRNILESYGHEKKCFLTLTYSDENLPLNDKGFPTLNKTHYQKFLKRLRRKYEGKIRYYFVGEYGTAGERGINPHYHALLYGIDQEHQQLIDKCWSLGHTLTANLEPESIAYVTGYVEKKTQYNKDMYEELEIVPEFSAMSLKPTIGAYAIPKLTKLFKNNPQYLTEHGDVPYSIMHGSRSLPLGQYIREKIRIALDLPHDLEEYYNDDTGEIIEKKIWHGKEAFKHYQKTKMQILQSSEEFSHKITPDQKVSIKQFYKYQNDQSHKNFDAKQKLKQNRKIL